MSIKRRFRKWLYKLVKEEEAVSSENWQRHTVPLEDIMPCIYCQRPIMKDSLFCRHCGFALIERRQQTTGSQKLVLAVKPQTPAPVMNLTGQIESAIKPNEKHPRIRAYNRLRRAGKV
jgi:hypothetical protein